MKEALKLLKDLADLQNGPPLEQHRKQWEETMERVYAFLNKHESDTMTPEDAIDILIRHNEWRRGGKGEMVTPEQLSEAIDVVTSGAVFTFSTTDPQQALRWSKADDMASALWELVNNGWREFKHTDYDYERAWQVIHETLEDHRIEVEDIWN